MTEPLGGWTNAPLAYVLAEVRTELLSDIKNYHPTISGRLREQFPIQRTMQAAKLVATGNKLLLESEQDSALEFVSPDNRRAVILRTSGLVLHATKYQDSSEFLDCLNTVVRVLHEVVPSVYVNRLGLRYVDFVVPSPGEKPEHYVDHRLNPDLGISPQEGGAIATSLAVYPKANGQLTLRYIRGRGQPELPPDLAMLSLSPSPLMRSGSGTVSDSQPTAVLDTDRIYICNPPEPLVPDIIQQHFRGMKDDVSKAFKDVVITQHARAVWGAS